MDYDGRFTTSIPPTGPRVLNERSLNIPPPPVPSTDSPSLTGHERDHSPAPRRSRPVYTQRESRRHIAPPTAPGERDYLQVPETPLTRSIRSIASARKRSQSRSRSRSRSRGRSRERSGSSFRFRSKSAVRSSASDDGEETNDVEELDGANSRDRSRSRSRISQTAADVAEEISSPIEPEQPQQEQKSHRNKLRKKRTPRLKLLEQQDLEAMPRREKRERKFKIIRKRLNSHAIFGVIITCLYLVCFGITWQEHHRFRYHDKEQRTPGADPYYMWMVCATWITLSLITNYLAARSIFKLWQFGRIYQDDWKKYEWRWKLFSAWGRVFSFLIYSTTVAAFVATIVMLTRARTMDIQRGYMPPDPPHGHPTDRPEPSGWV
ncbi:hypothetical protein TWF694_009219 [Orbilia ellipsospora]|uniref:Uncharacterized protein n=1 Tax=Orbilia ellipsospora TaxID=2528407 RepID=A0AAV9XKX5_9PEZI